LPLHCSAHAVNISLVDLKVSERLRRLLYANVSTFGNATTPRRRNPSGPSRSHSSLVLRIVRALGTSSRGTPSGPTAFVHAGGLVPARAAISSATPAATAISSRG